MQKAKGKKRKQRKTEKETTKKSENEISKQQTENWKMQTKLPAEREVGKETGRKKKKKY